MTNSSAAKQAALRVPPHSIDAERSVLGGLMLDNQAWDKVVDRVIDSDFYRFDHTQIFRAISWLVDHNQPFDLITVAEHLKSTGDLEKVGDMEVKGMAYLGALASQTPTAANVDAYADIVREHSVLRQIIRVGTDIAEMAYKADGKDARQQLDQAERAIFQIADQRLESNQGIRPVSHLLTSVVERIDTLYSEGNAITGLATGFNDIDERTSGLHNGDLVVIAGRPSMGKTALAMNIVEQVAIKAKRTVAMFSMEMPGEALVMRLIASLGRLSMQKIRTGRLNDDDWPRVTSAISLLSESPLYIHDGSALNPTEIRSGCRRIKREHDLGLVVVDYLQLMQSPGNSDENRATEIADISRSLKAMAKELNVPVVALSQLNRSLESRPNKRPIMSDLRESGAIEQDADLILFIYRDEIYNPETSDQGVAEIITGKQRNGPIGTDKLTFLGQYLRFENHADNERYGD